MAHFAKIEDGVVTQVVVVDNKDTADASGVEKEYIGAAFLERLLGGTWKQTSYNGNIRGRYAGIGFTYDADLDMFIAPKPFPSWSLDANGDWQAPTPSPTSDNPEISYRWNEETQSWDEVNFSQPE
jgi:hypothetical protein